jgi:hypothetical protein
VRPPRRLVGPDPLQLCGQILATAAFDDPVVECSEAFDASKRFDGGIDVRISGDSRQCSERESGEPAKHCVIIGNRPRALMTQNEDLQPVGTPIAENLIE